MSASTVVTSGRFVIFIFKEAGSSGVRFGTEGADPRFRAKVCRVSELQSSPILRDYFRFSLWFDFYVDSKKSFEIEY